MTTPVKLYVYDLSNGLAKQLSKQLTGTQIDGIWHTSVVVFGKEVFYGQGIDTSKPGRSHHGTPLQIIDVGETALDEATFNEYLDEIREHYSADKYHLLDFDCNSFTNDCVGFLTVGDIPAFIKDLPTEFLATPFGAALRPTIDAMYKRPSSGAVTPAVNGNGTNDAINVSPNPALAASILQSVVSQATQSSPQETQPLQATQTLTSPIHICTNPSSFHSLLSSHRAVIGFFTSSTCGPCKMIEPTFESLAHEKGSKAAFVKIDMDVGMGSQVASEYNVRVTPTFIFFLDGKKVSEMKGADAGELKTQIDLLLFDAYPPHPHKKLSLRGISSFSLTPILFTQVPNIDTATNKLFSFIDASSSPELKKPLIGSVTPFLRARYTNKDLNTKASPTMLVSWTQTTHALLSILPPDQLFPLVDLWRIALLDPSIGAWLTQTQTTTIPSLIALAKMDVPRNFLLTTLRLLANCFSSNLGSSLLAAPQTRDDITSVVVQALLHADAGVRTAAASCAFNIAALVQASRQKEVFSVGDDGDWEVEVASAILEALDRENASEEVVHRLVASLGLLLYMSPSYEAQLAPLLEVLQAKDVVQRKLALVSAGKKDVRRLVEEVGELCP